MAALSTSAALNDPDLECRSDNEATIRSDEPNRSTRDIEQTAAQHGENILAIRIRVLDNLNAAVDTANIPSPSGLAALV